MVRKLVITSAAVASLALGLVLGGWLRL